MPEHRFELLNAGGVTRRAMLMMPAALAGLAAASWPKDRPVPDSKESGTGRKVHIVLFSDDGKRDGKIEVGQIRKSDEEWKKQLQPDEYAVTRRAGTEPAYTGRYWDNHERGIYRCVCCGNALFDSRTKFDSHTGWPSFWAPIASENVRERSDSSLDMIRTEVLCTKCEAHLGHVFNDGPPPTHLRYCMNSVALIFVKA